MTVLSSSFATSSSYSVTASNADLLDGLHATSFVLNSQTSSMNVLSASYATTSSYASVAQTLLGSVVSASYALTASYALNGGGGGTTITTQDEGSTLSSTVTTLNFVGAGVTAAGAGATTTITIPGGSGAAFPYTGSAQITGSLGVTGSIAISQAILQYSNNAAILSGSTAAIATFATSSYMAGFFDFVASSGTSARAGTVFTVWNGASLEYVETSTNDIGNTSNLLLSASLSGTNVVLQGTSLSGSWNVKTLTRML
jgi:hypothetical protein